MKKFLLAIFILSLAIFGLIDAVLAEQNPVTVYFFYNSGCSHCTAEKPFLAGLLTKYPSLVVKSYEVWSNQENVELFNSLAKVYNTTSNSVPMTFIGEEVISGYSTDEKSGKEIEEKIKNCLNNGCIDPITKLEPAVQPKVPKPVIEAVANENNSVVENSHDLDINSLGSALEAGELAEGIQTINGEPVRILINEQKMKLMKTGREEKTQREIYEYFPAAINQDLLDSIKIKSKLLIILESGQLIAKENDNSWSKEIKNKPEAVIVAIKDNLADITIEEIVLTKEGEKPVYDLILKQPADLFSLIPIKIKTKLQVNAEENKVLSFKKPWWSFLASGIKNINF